jgi:SAM-dependent methyltransferase
VARRFQTAILRNPYVDGKHIPLGDGVRRAKRDDSAGSDDGLPIPPQHLWEDYATTPDAYVESGRTDVEAMLAVLQAGGANLDKAKRVLDLGCAGGRMLRAFPRGDRELWGVDISAPHIAWCEANLCPPMQFATTTTLPHLPFEDSTFDLIWCGSVFTHISDLATAWLLETRRVLAPGGYAYITIHTKRSVELLETKFLNDSVNGPFARAILRYDTVRAFPRSDDAAVVVGVDPHSQVFYDIDNLVNRWSAILEVVSTTEEAHDYQAAVMLRKR